MPAMLMFAPVAMAESHGEMEQLKTGGPAIGSLHLSFAHLFNKLPSLSRSCKASERRSMKAFEEQSSNYNTETA